MCATTSIQQRVRPSPLGFPGSSVGFLQPAPSRRARGSCCRAERQHQQGKELHPLLNAGPFPARLGLQHPPAVPRCPCHVHNPPTPRTYICALCGVRGSGVRHCDWNMMGSGSALSLFLPSNVLGAEPSCCQSHGEGGAEGGGREVKVFLRFLNFCACVRAGWELCRYRGAWNPP